MQAYPEIRGLWLTNLACQGFQSSGIPFGPLNLRVLIQDRRDAIHAKSVDQSATKRALRLEILATEF